MPSLLSLTEVIPESYHVVKEIFEMIDFPLTEDASNLDGKSLETFARLLVERVYSKDERRKIIMALKDLLKRSGNTLYHKFESRVAIKKLPINERRGNFNEVIIGYTLEEGRREAQRCLGCKNPRCVKACPIHFSIPVILKLVAEGRLEQAYRVGLAYYPFLGIMGRICVRFCERACIMNELGIDPLAIRHIHRLIADHVDKNKVKSSPKKLLLKKVAIIGSGPAGMNAAYHLALMGYSVTIYEKADMVGGVPRLLIPEFRLPSKIIEEEWSIVKDLDIRVELNKYVGKDVMLSDLDRNYDAIFISVGAHKLKKIGVPGEDLQGVMQALPFLHKVKRGEIKSIRGKVWVIGGGDVAMDAARSALRLGASQVKIMYRRSKMEMPADSEQVEDAEREGIDIMMLAAPVEFIGKDGVLKKMKCIKMKLGEPGPDGRRKPIPIPGSEFMEDVDVAILAIGQDPDLSFIKPEDGIELTEWGTIKVDGNMMTTKPGIFAGGDAVRGSATIIEALTDGKCAALNIANFLSHRDNS